MANINDLKTGQSAKIKAVGGSGQLRQHFLDMGIIPGAELTLIKYAPLGDPLEIRIHGYELTLRIAEAKEIEVETVHEHSDGAGESSYVSETPQKDSVHPGLGESGKRYHVKADENPLPDGTVLNFALAGNQNSGKTTLFNQLTGSNQHVGNFPGVTVDRKDGWIRGYQKASVTDLPGIYSMSPYTAEEIVSREFIIGEKPNGIINIVDATNIERNLYLTMQLMELDVPIVLALNMMDEVRGNGGTVFVNEMEDLLGIPVVPISAAKNEGVDELIDHALHIAKYQERPGRTDFCEETSPVHRAIHAVMHLIEDHAQAAALPVRFAATKLIEGDELIEKSLFLSENEKEMIEHIAQQLEEESGIDRAAAIAQMRFDFIKKLVKRTVIKPTESREHARSTRIDKILTGRFTAIPAFIAIMGLIFWLTFNVVGAFLQEKLAAGIELMSVHTGALLDRMDVNDAVHSLVTDGIFAGVGSVVSFLPIIIVLFFFLSLLEDSGYMARVAFFMDKLLRKIGLSGRSIVPMLIGFGCSVPGIMAARTLPSERDRKMTVLLTPFMSCSAKLPIYAFFTAAFFPGHGALVMIGLYFLGIVMGVLTALVSKNTAFRGEAMPFVMELPNYRLPSAKNTGMLLWSKAKDFLERAFTVIFIATIVIWFLEAFDFRFGLAASPADSILASLAGVLVPLFAPLGLGDFRIVTALISGVLAKESVVSTLAVLFGGEAGVLSAFTQSSALSMLVFCLLYTPCIAAVETIRRELGIRWAAFTVLFQCALAWLVSLAVYMLL